MQYRFMIPRIGRLLRGLQMRVLPTLLNGFLLVVCLASCSTGGGDEAANALPEVFRLPHSRNADYEGVILARKYFGSRGPLLYTGKNRAKALKSGPNGSSMDDCIVLLLGSVKNPGKLRKGDVVRVWTNGIVFASSPGQVGVVRIEKIDKE